MSRFIALSLVVACSGAPTPTAPAMTGWQAIDGGPTTGCSGGTPYRFFVRRGDQKKLAVVFQGGGACWRFDMCDVAGEPTFDPIVDDTDTPERAGGILDLANPANPVRDYTIVFVPYCTGDVHLGARDARYDKADRAIEIRHRGLANARRAVDWAYEHVARPEVVLIAGMSAGAFPVPVFAAEVAQHHPAARVVGVADGDGSYRGPRVAEVFAEWRAPEALASQFGFLSIDPAKLSLEAMIGAASRAAPRITLAELNAIDDDTQRWFHVQLGETTPDIKASLAANLADVRRVAPGFRAYTRPGKTHTLINQPELYTTEVDGVRARDWLAAMLAGDQVRDVGEALLR